MKFLYVSNSCSEKKYNELFSNVVKKPAVQANKFNRLIAEGLVKNHGVDVVVLSKLALNKDTYKKMIYWGDREVDNDISYVYIPQINVGVLNHIVTFIYGFIYSLIFSLKNKDSILIIDVLNISIGLGSTLAYKLKRLRSIGIVTDLPKYFGGKKTQKLIQHIIDNCKMYVLLTDSMSNIVNKKAKPYVVIEGISDINNKADDTLVSKYKEKIIMYAGSFDRRFGIRKLIDAFIKVKDDDARLWIFGSGDSEKEVLEAVDKDPRIFFGGMRLNKEIMETETKATLLVNPRPSNEEMTKYSFPSKIMEYMSTGTPALITKLEGIPIEYHDHVYFFEDESIEGMSKTIGSLLNKPREELHEKGEKGKKFVIEEKNNIIQVRKIIEMLQKGEIDDGKKK